MASASVTVKGVKAKGGNNGGCKRRCMAHWHGPQLPRHRYSLPFPPCRAYPYIYQRRRSRTHSTEEEYICAVESKATNLLSAQPVSNSQLVAYKTAPRHHRLLGTCFCCCRWSSLQLRPSRRASHAGHAADAATPRDVVLGTLEMSSSGGCYAGQSGGEPAGRPQRVRCTRELHRRFVLAVSELGGADKATPKAVLRVMDVRGLTLHHLKSYLQKYRMAVSRGLVEVTDDNGEGQNDRSSSSENQPDEYDEDTVTEMYRTFANDESEVLCDSSRSVTWMQREVQRNLQEQIEVQRHLQLRIEAQGRYLQSVLRRAEEVLADYSLDLPEAELSELVSAAASTSSSLSLSPLHYPSTASCVTSSSSSEAESKASAKRLCACADMRECTVEQPVQSKRGVLQSNRRQQGDADEAEAEADAENGSSGIDLNR